MKPLVGAVLIVLALAIVLFLAREPILLAVGDFLVVRDDLQPADVIHVIAGSDDRTDYAIELYRQGYGKRIFFTGGWCQYHGYYHGQHGTQRAIEQGVPAEAIAVDESWVTSTYSEAVRLKEFVAHGSAPIRSVIIVSDPHHMRRARWTYQRVLGDGVKVLMAPVPFELSPDRRRWWTDGETREMVWREYLKLAYYRARYELNWGPLRKWLASLDVN
jgi:uncharacterized SAM-binding protein YcdF (DUF218 family)